MASTRRLSASPAEKSCSTNSPYLTTSRASGPKSCVVSVAVATIIGADALGLGTLRPWRDALTGDPGFTDVDDVTAGLRDLLRRPDVDPNRVGVVFQENACFPWLTVADNITFGLKRLSLPKDEVERRLLRALQLMGLQEFARAYPAQLSGGMRQRVCIARTLVLSPKVLLLDEPFGALDQQTRLLMGDELLRIWRETGATVVLITHALDEAAMLSDRVAVMSARPGRFIDVVTTGWPRARDSRIVSDARFGAVTARLWEKLREESLRAMGVAAPPDNRMI